MRYTFFKFLLVFFLSAPLISITFADEDDFRARAHQFDISGDTEEDVNAEIRFGKSIAARILGQFPVYYDTTLTTYINLIGKSLALNSSRDDITFHFSILEADFINAYSAPGGYVFITLKTILSMQDEAELAAVLAHEIAHITEKHIVKEFKIRGQDKSKVAGVSRLIGSSKSSAQALFSQAVDNAVKKLLEQGFKQKDEFASDEIALLLLANTGYDPMALARYLTRIKNLTEKKPQTSQHKATHPPTLARIQALQKLAQTESLDKLNFPKAKSRFDKYVKK